MAQRVIYNSFVGGEIAPELWGRHDLRAYFQGVARAENWVARPSGGLRKRAGTKLVGQLGDGAGVPEDGFIWRVFPFFFDRTRSALFCFRSDGTAVRLWVSLFGNGERIAAQEYGEIPGLLGVTQKQIRSAQAKQFGDYLYLSGEGFRLLRFRLDDFGVDFSVSVEEMPTRAEVEVPPTLKATASGFGSTSENPGYVAAEKKYRLYGVKNGIYSEPADVSVNITLAWKAGAKVTLSFTPQWWKHDYYVVGKLMGAQYGVLSSIYPDTQSYNVKDTNFSGSGASSAVFGGTTYHAPQTSYNTSFHTADPNRTNAGGEHSGACFVPFSGGAASLVCSAAGSIQSILLWVGAQLSDGSALHSVGTSGELTAEFVIPGAEEEIIGSWPISSYAEDYQRLVITSPTYERSQYIIRIKSTDENAAAFCLRGCVLVSDTATQEVIDDNIVPVSLVAEQDLLHVGDSGMDIALTEVWEQRLVLASSRSLPFSLWFSRVGDLGNFYAERPQTQACAFSVSIPPWKASKLLHILGGKFLLAFTESGEYAISGSTSEGFGFSTVTIRRTSAVGALAEVPPVQTQTHVLFVAADARSVFDIRYRLEEDSLVPRDRSLFARHITAGRSIIAMAYQQFPDGVVWFLFDDGALGAMTYDPEQEIWAWTRHTLAPLPGWRLIDIIAPGSVTESRGREQTSNIFLAWQSETNGEIRIERMKEHSFSDTFTPGTDATIDHEGTEGAAALRATIETLPPELPDYNTMGITKLHFNSCLRLRRSGKLNIRPLTEDGGAGLGYAQSILPVGAAELTSGDVEILPRAFNGKRGRMEITSADEKPAEILSVLFNIDSATK